MAKIGIKNKFFNDLSKKFRHIDVWTGKIQPKMTKPKAPDLLYRRSLGWKTRESVVFGLARGLRWQTDGLVSVVVHSALH